MLIRKLVIAAEAGATWVLYLLIALSVLSIGIILERWLWFRSRRVDAAALGRDIVKSLEAGDVAAARKRVSRERCVEARVLDLHVDCLAPRVGVARAFLIELANFALDTISQLLELLGQRVETIGHGPAPRATLQGKRPPVSKRKA